MASTLDVLSAAGSVAGVVGVAYQIYSTHRQRDVQRQAKASPPAPAPAPTPAAASVPAPAPASSPPPRVMTPPAWTPTPVAEPETLWDLVAPVLMGAYLWLMALGGYAYIDDVNLAGPTPEAITAQLRYSVVLLAINTVWAGALVYRHIQTRPRPTRVWVYGLAGIASIAADIGLLATHGSTIF